MLRITEAIGKNRHVVILLVDNPVTAWEESVRDLLVVPPDPTFDRNAYGWTDANNDKDCQDLNQNGIRYVGR